MRHAFLRKINHFVIIVNLLSFTYTGSDRCEKLERDRRGGFDFEKAIEYTDRYDACTRVGRDSWRVRERERESTQQ